MRIKPKDSEIAEIYIDESSQTKHRYLVLGCVVVSMEDCGKLNALIDAARLPELPDKEPKWTKVSNAKLPAYKRIVDVLFDNSALVHFHALVVDTEKLDDRRWNEGSREIGFNKEIYQLARKCYLLYSKSLFHLYPDWRDTKHKPEELRLILNRGCAKPGDTRDWPFRRCQFRHSHKTPALHLVDILIGALAYRLNGHHKKWEASFAKIELSRHVMHRAGIVDVKIDTARAGTFTVWHRQLRKGVSVA